MKIIFVMEAFGDFTNGTTATCMRTAKTLMKHGHDVSIICVLSPKARAGVKEEYHVIEAQEIHIPLFQGLIHKEGMMLGKAKYRDIAQAIRGADIVHLFLPFFLETQVRRVANAMSIPVTSAMHMQPENVSSAIGMGHSKAVNNFIYNYLYKTFYRYTRHIHTPSQMMADQMKLHHYPNVIHPISNGVDGRFYPMATEKPAELKDRIVVLMIGRLADEKRQDLIIKAVGLSKYNDRIQVILAGQGQNEKKLRRLAAKKLKNPIDIGFHEQDELFRIINYCDIYIHASDAESEAISCIEAFSCGKVPIISDSPISATNHFALDEKCLFRAGDPESLKERLEYWIEHPEEKAELEKRYAEYGKTFALDGCALQLEEMFAQAIEDEKTKGLYYTQRKELRKVNRIKKKLGL